MTIADHARIQETITKNWGTYANTTESALDLRFNEAIIGNSSYLVPHISPANRASTQQTSLLQKICNCIIQCIGWIRYYLFNMPDFNTEKIIKKIEQIHAFSEQQIRTFINKPLPEQQTSLAALQKMLQKLQKFAKIHQDSSSYPKFVDQINAKLRFLMQNFQDQWQARKVGTQWFQPLFKKHQNVIKFFLVTPKIQIDNYDARWSWDWRKIKSLCLACKPSARVHNPQAKEVSEQKSSWQNPLYQLSALYDCAQDILNYPPVPNTFLSEMNENLDHKFMETQGFFMGSTRALARYLEEAYATQAIPRLSSALSTTLIKKNGARLAKLAKEMPQKKQEYTKKQLEKLTRSLEKNNTNNPLSILSSEAMWSKEIIENIINKKIPFSEEALSRLYTYMAENIATIYKLLINLRRDTPEQFKKATQQKLEKTIQEFEEGAWARFCTVHDKLFTFNLEQIDPEEAFHTQEINTSYEYFAKILQNQTTSWFNQLKSDLQQVKVPDWVKKYSPVSLKTVIIFLKPAKEPSGKSVIDSPALLFPKAYETTLAAKYQKKDFTSFYLFFTQRFLDCFEINRSGALVANQDPKQLFDNGINKNHWPVFLQHALEIIKEFLKQDDLQNDSRIILELYKKAIETFHLYENPQKFTPNRTIIKPPCLDTFRATNPKDPLFFRYDINYLDGLFTNSDIIPRHDWLKRLSVFVSRHRMVNVIKRTHFTTLGCYISEKNRKPFCLLVYNILVILQEQFTKSDLSYHENLHLFAKTIHQMDANEKSNNEQKVIYECLRLLLTLQLSKPQNSFAELLQLHLEQLRWKILKDIIDQKMEEQGPRSREKQEHQKEKIFLHVLKKYRTQIGIPNLGVDMDISTVESSDDEENLTEFLATIPQIFNEKYTTRAVLQVARKIVEKSEENAFLFKKQLRQLGINFPGNPVHANDFIYLQFLLATKSLTLKGDTDFTSEIKEKVSKDTDTKEDYKRRK